MLGLAAVPAIILLLGVLRLPESPRFLVKKGFEKEAKEVLTLIREKDEIEPELKEIIKTAKDEKYSGLAFGIGIERTAMLKYGINNIKMLFESDVRVLSQIDDN